jgi:hypothetical protein
MVPRSLDQATDCEKGSTDWTTIGTRILEAALIASAFHARECRRPAGAGSVANGWPAGDRELVIDRREAGPAWE